MTAYYLQRLPPGSSFSLNSVDPDEAKRYDSSGEEDLRFPLVGCTSVVAEKFDLIGGWLPG